MGAIYGFWGFGDASSLNAMGRRLAHRGCNRVEEELDDGVWLGGVQPRGGRSFLTTIRGHTIATDAHIVNRDELTEELMLRGHSLRIGGDDELLLRMYLEFGPGGFARVAGHFAAAIWDGTRRRLYLVRDPAGSRPVFFWKEGGQLAFGSEYKALLALDQVPARPDLAALQQLQSRKLLPPGRTLLRGIEALRAGCWLQLGSPESPIAKEVRYWRIAVEVQQRSVGAHANRLRNELLEALLRCADRFERIGISLSGGIDSIAVASGLRHLYPDRDIHTFTAGSGPEDGDIRAARAVAEKLRTDHREVFIGPDQLKEVIPKVVWHMEDPIARSETVQVYETMRDAGGRVDAIFGGYAADQLYAGMRRHKLAWIAQQAPMLRRPLEEFYGFTQTGSEPSTFLGGLLIGVYFHGSRPPALRVTSAPAATPPDLFPIAHGAARLEMLNTLLRDGMYSDLPQWLPKIDRLVFAHAIPFFSPFLDPTVIRSAFRIPSAYKIRFWQEKYVLRQALKPLIPAELLGRRKFPQRMTYDLEFSEALDALADETLSYNNVRARGFFDWAELCRLRTRSARKPYTAEHGMRIWTALLTEQWAQLFLDGRGAPPVGRVD